MASGRNETLAILKYHFVWRTMGKEPVLQDAIKHRTRELIRQGCDFKKITILRGIVNPSYVCISLSCGAGHAPSKVAQMLKGRTSKMLSDEFPGQIKKNLWEEGYLCLTFSELDEEEVASIIARYIKSGFQPQPLADFSRIPDKTSE